MTTRRHMGISGWGKGFASHVEHVTSREICNDANKVGFLLGCTAHVDPVDNEGIYPCQEPNPTL